MMPLNADVNMAGRTTPGVSVLTDHRKIGVDFSFNQKLFWKTAWSLFITEVYTAEKERSPFLSNSHYYRSPIPYCGLINLLLCKITFIAFFSDYKLTTYFG